MFAIVDYNIVKAYSIEALAREVAVLMKSGWQPHGGVATAVDLSNCSHYVQAMVKFGGTR